MPALRNVRQALDAVGEADGGVAADFTLADGRIASVRVSAEEWRMHGEAALRREMEAVVAWVDEAARMGAGRGGAVRRRWEEL
jgi:hypothetical protein